MEFYIHSKILYPHEFHSNFMKAKPQIAYFTNSRLNWKANVFFSTSLSSRRINLVNPSAACFSRRESETVKDFVFCSLSLNCYLHSINDLQTEFSALSLATTSNDPTCSRNLLYCWSKHSHAIYFFSNVVDDEFSDIELEKTQKTGSKKEERRLIYTLIRMKIHISSLEWFISIPLQGNEENPSENRIHVCYFAFSVVINANT